MGGVKTKFGGERLKNITGGVKHILGGVKIVK